MYDHELVLSGPCPFMSIYTLTMQPLQSRWVIRQGWLTPRMSHSAK